MIAYIGLPLALINLIVDMLGLVIFSDNNCLASFAVPGAFVDDAVEEGIEGKDLRGILLERVELHEFHALGQAVEVFAAHALYGPLDSLDLEQGPEIEKV